MNWFSNCHIVLNELSDEINKLYGCRGRSYGLDRIYPRYCPKFNIKTLRAMKLF